MSRAALLALAALLLGVAACERPEAAPTPPRGRVLLVGLDGATLHVIEPLLAAGRLPHLAALAEQGTSGPLRSLFPLLSPRVWTTIATGKPPEQHGIEGWVRLGRDGAPTLYTSADRKVHALWNIVSDAGLRVGVVNWLGTHPPERVNGVMISYHAVPGALEGRISLARQFAAQQFPEAEGPVGVPAATAPVVHPVEWAERVHVLGASREPVVPAETLREAAVALGERYVYLVSQIWRSDEAVARLALETERREQPDLLMVMLPGIDRICHFLWYGMEPPEAYPEPSRHSEAQRRAARALVEGYYEVSDALLGRFMEGFGPEDLVLVVSDHGFEAGEIAEGLTGLHNTEAAQDGILFARGPGVPRAGRAAGVAVADVTPTVLRWLGLPTARDMAGRPAPFLDVEATASVATHDGAAIERVEGSGSGVDDAIVEQLRQLGYVK